MLRSSHQVLFIIFRYGPGYKSSNATTLFNLIEEPDTQEKGSIVAELTLIRATRRICMHEPADVSRRLVESRTDSNIRQDSRARIVTTRRSQMEFSKISCLVF